MDQEVLDARAKLAARFGKTQVGGKGTQRRTKKVVHHQEVNEDKKLKSTIKKFGMQSLQDIDEVNMFKDDNTVIHLKRPQSKSIMPHFKYNFNLANTLINRIF